MTLTISLYVPGMGFGPDSLTEQSLGGSESAALSMAIELARRGHQVTVFCTIDQPAVGHGVRFVPAADYPSFAGEVPHDVTIVQRALGMLTVETRARLNILWQHDLTSSHQQGEFAGIMWNLDRIAVVSRYMAEHYQAALRCDAELLWVTRNGIDPGLVPGAPVARDPHKLVYAARPERGLDVLLGEIMPALLARDPRISLDICGYDHSVRRWQTLYATCRTLAERLGDRVRFMPPMAKPALYRHYRSAGAYIYPSPSEVLPTFREVSCISAMEAMLCGLPFIGSENGALPETLGVVPKTTAVLDPLAPGHLIAGTPQQPGHNSALIDAVLHLMGSDDLQTGMRRAAEDRAKLFHWAALAEEWETAFLQMIAQRNASGQRLAIHLT